MDITRQKTRIKNLKIQGMILASHAGVAHCHDSLRIDLKSIPEGFVYLTMEVIGGCLLSIATVKFFIDL